MIEVTNPGVNPLGTPMEDRHLASVIAAFQVPAFAVVDGGHFDDFPALLRRTDLFGRSLFLDHADKEVEARGPWLVGLAQSPDALDRLTALVGDAPATVFWSCAGGEAVLYRHLRTLNMARIPAWAAVGQGEPRADGSDADLEVVMFRHWDPRLLGALMPVLDAGQFARVLGPADEIAFRADAFGGVKRVPADPRWPAPPSGMLTLSTEQMRALNERRVESRRRSVAAYLRDTADGALDDASEADVRAHVLTSEGRARELGIVTDAGHCRWAFLMMITRGRVGTDQTVTDFVRNGARSPDDQVEDIMDATSRAVRGASSSRPSGARL